MRRQAQSEEEYIRMVKEQGERQEKEHVPSHRQLRDNYFIQSKNFQQKECFYTILLIIVLLSFVGLKLFPQYLGLQPTEVSEL